MAITILDFGVGLGITDSGRGTYRWNGHSFNPTANTACGYQTWDIFTYPNALGSVYRYGSTTNFDLSNFQFGNEVVMGVLVWGSTYQDSGIVTERMRDTENNILIEASFPWSLEGPGYFRYVWMGIGSRADGVEIHDDGTYSYQYVITYGGGSVSNTTYFTISNYPPATYVPTHIGKIWVESYYLAYACPQGYKVLCDFDGSGTYVGTQYSGKIWLETNGKIAYIDEYGYKRMTKLGDRYGFNGWTTELPSSPGTTHQGKIYMSPAPETDTYLVVVSADGVKYRIGAGYALTGDYQ